ncbi:MAG: autotransporter outer membrane beta-barrel domain-containing protein [Puniceicoccales bacterium]|jgi:hypothetical protein|nr:autotransporter outer membrane beta-barrel domain-containing protein [Puniceicoccales bacterium]
MKNLKILFYSLALAVAPALSFGGAFRNPFFESAGVVRENIDALDSVVTAHADSALNELDAKAKRTWLDSGYINHHQSLRQGLGYDGDTFSLAVGTDHNYSKQCPFLDKFLDSYAVGAFAAYNNTSVDYKGAETLGGDKTKNSSLAFGLYSGYGSKRWSIFSLSLFSAERYKHSLSMHSGADLSGALAKVDTHTFRGNSVHSNVKISYKCLCKQLTIEPEATLLYGKIGQKKHGDGTLSLAKQRMEYLQAIFGVKLGMTANVGTHRIKPQLFVGLARDVHRRDKIAETQAPIAQTIFERGRGSAVVKASLSLLINGTMDADISYRGEYFKHNQAHALIAGISYKF